MNNYFDVCIKAISTFQGNIFRVCLQNEFTDNESEEKVKIIFLKIYEQRCITHKGKNISIRLEYE